jgi:hypothetical protein
VSDYLIECVYLPLGSVSHEVQEPDPFCVNLLIKCLTQCSIVCMCGRKGPDYIIAFLLTATLTLLVYIGVYRGVFKNWECTCVLGSKTGLQDTGHMTLLFLKISKAQ